MSRLSGWTVAGVMLAMLVATIDYLARVILDTRPFGGMYPRDPSSQDPRAYQRIYVDRDLSRW